MNQFHQYMDKRAEPTPTPPPEWNIQDLSQNFSNAKGAELKPLTDDDMARYAFDDVVNQYIQMHKDRPASGMGPPMTDAEFRKFLGQ